MSKEVICRFLISKQTHFKIQGPPLSAGSEPGWGHQSSRARPTRSEPGARLQCPVPRGAPGRGGPAASLAGMTNSVSSSARPRAPAPVMYDIIPFQHYYFIFRIIRFGIQVAEQAASRVGAAQCPPASAGPGPAAWLRSGPPAARGPGPGPVH